MADPAPTAPPVALVIQRRIADAGYADFVHWTARSAERLKSWPGFISQDVVAL